VHFFAYFAVDARPFQWYSPLTRERGTNIPGVPPLHRQIKIRNSSRLEEVCAVGALTADIISQFRALVANRIGEARYRTWFGESASFRQHPGGVEIAVPNNFVGNWIASNYMNDLVASAHKPLTSIAT